MSNQDERLRSVCRKIIKYCAMINNKEEVLILCDTTSDQKLINTIYETILEIGANVSIMKRKPPSRPHDLPPITVDYAMMGSDVIIDLSKYDILHTLPIRRALLDCGSRLINMTGHDSNTLIKPNIADVDYENLHKKAIKLVEILENGSQFIYKNPRGTHLEADITGRKWYALDGIARELGSFAVYPVGEVLGSAVPGTPNGIVYLDYLATFGKLKIPIKLFIENGWVKNIEGGEEAEKLKELWVNVENSNYIGELGGIGINDLNEFSERIDAVEEQMKLGVAHIGFGDSLTYGDKISSKLHLNGSITNIHIIVDGRTLIKDNKMQF